jgi:hypothetical protein
MTGRIWLDAAIREAQMKFDVDAISTAQYYIL